MSLPWRSELTLRLSPRRCRAWLAAPWSRRVLWRVVGDGVPAASIPAALDALQAAAGTAPPRRARLLLADEHAYLSLRPARPRWSDALGDAREHFEQILGLGCRVQVAQGPMGPWWLAAAVHGTDLEDWSAAAGSRGVTFDRVEPALVEDLRALAPRAGEQAVLALLGEEGVVVVRIAAGAPVELSWERCDPRTPRGIEQRLIAFQKSPGVSQSDPLLLVCRDPELVRVWRPQAQAYGWTLVELPWESPPPQPQPKALAQPAGQAT